MKYSLVAALALLSSSAFAGLSSRPAGEYNQDRSGNLEGIYAAVGAGGQLMVFGGNNAFGYDVEARLGYSFSAPLQLYLSGALDGATFSGATAAFKAEQVALFIQYHLLVRSAVMIYARVGLGVGLSSDFVPGSTAAGLAEAGGVGVEIRLAPGFFIAPEFFYRGSNLSAQGASDSYQSVGLQLNIVYY